MDIPTRAWTMTRRSSNQKSELSAELAIERIGPAAAQQDGQPAQFPEQRVFPSPAGPAPVEPRQTATPMGDKDDDQKLDEDHGREQSREQAENDANGADGFQEENHVGGGNSRLDAAPRHAIGGKCCDRT